MKLPAPLFLIVVFFTFASSAIAKVYDLRLEMPRDQLAEFLKSEELSNLSRPVSVEVDGKKVADGELKLKGHTTRLFPKRGFTLKFKDKEHAPEFVDGLREIKLNPMYTDKSFLREKLVWDLYRDMQGFGPRELGYARLTINGADCGLYLIMQSINKEFLHRQDRKGSLFEAASSADLKPISWDDLENVYVHKHGEEIYPVLKKLIGSLNTAKSDAEFAKVFHEQFEIKSVYDWLALNAVAMAGDSYVKNYFLFFDKEKKANQWSIIPWDYDISFGRDGNPKQAYPQQILNNLFSYSYPILSGPDNVLKDRILTNPILRDEFKKHLHHVINKHFTPEKLNAEIDKTAAEIEKHSASGVFRWGAARDFREQIDALKFFITARRNFLHSQFIEKPSGENDSAAVDISEQKSNYEFVDRQGRTIATFKLKKMNGLKQIAVRVFPSLMPPGLTNVGVKRYIEITAVPAKAKFEGELRWEYLDSVELSEVTAGLMQDKNFVAKVLENGQWKSLPTKLNTYANLATIPLDQNSAGAGHLIALVSPDNGASPWKVQNSETWHNLTSIEVVKDNLLAVGSDDGFIFKSSDGGKTWSSSRTGSRTSALKVSVFDGNVFVVDHFGQIFSSDERLNSWSEAKKAPPAAATDRLFRRNDQEFWSLADSGKIKVSYDAGKTWKSRQFAENDEFNGVAFSEDAVVVVGNNGAILYGKNLDSMKAESNPATEDLLAVAFSKANKTFIAVGRYGVAITRPSN